MTAMTNEQTFELTIFPGTMRMDVLAFIRAQGIEDFVESAGEVNADEDDWDLAFDDWSKADLGPILIYRSSRDELSSLILQLKEKFSVTIHEKWIADTLWKEAWEPGFSSLETERFFIAAPSIEGGEGKIRLRLIESQVFGSGQHATTQALIRLLEKRTGLGRFLDVGTGTGVLCLAAHHLGFDTLCGTDIEDSAILNSQENAHLNEISIELLLGSLPVLDKPWDAIACNILPPTLTDLLQDLKHRLAPHGSLYLAGFNEANAEGVLAEITRLHLTVADECKVRGWIGWLVTHAK